MMNKLRADQQRHEYVIISVCAKEYLGQGRNCEQHEVTLAEST